MEQLTDNQINLIVEALLFGACLEITDSWSVDDREEMISIAKNLTQQSTTLNNIQLHSIDADSSIVEEIKAVFPQINIVTEI